MTPFFRYSKFDTLFFCKLGVNKYVTKIRYFQNEFAKIPPFFMENRILLVTDRLVTFLSLSVQVGLKKGTGTSDYV